MYFRVTRLHSNGKMRRLKDKVYPGVLFPNANSLNLFIETQDFASSALNAGGLCISLQEDGSWKIGPLDPNHEEKIVLEK